MAELPTHTDAPTPGWMVAAKLGRIWWVDVLETLSGGALLTLALTNESQEKNVQSWLETAWLQLAYAEDAAINRHMQFMHQLANVCNSVLNHLFGKRLISLRSACRRLSSRRLAAYSSR